MVSPSEMKEVILDVYSNGFKKHIDNIIVEHKDREAVFLNKEKEYMSEAILEAYYCSINIQKNITDYPQILGVRIEHCEMSGDPQLYLNDYDGEKTKHHLIRNCWIDYVIEYNARMYGAKDAIESAIESFMECYCGIENNYDEDEKNSIEYTNDMDKLVNLYALVRYYCEDIYIYGLETTESSHSHRRIIESDRILGLTSMMAAKFPVVLQYSEKDLKNEYYNTPLDLFRAWENNHQLTELDLKYIKAFNIVIHFSAKIEEYNIFRRSYLYHDESKGGFIHMTQDNFDRSRFNYEQKIYTSAKEINELVSIAKTHSFKGFSLIEKDEMPDQY